ncbi:MAG: threonylcarbamoyl-AMP synthase [Chloroflexi bacterium RBG_16_50_9]|nr:MAG: threonylcarbamoyl-AMP synthase [Chloroflexi bacterium RBG_16_50_9]
MSARIEKVDAASPDSMMLRRAARLIAEGEVIVCPTDTGYAFSADALNTGAIVKVFHLKGRSYSNPIHVAVSTMEEAAKYAHIKEAARHLARRFLPGALTLVLPKKEIIPPILVSGRNTVGIRIPDNRTILQLSAMTGRPLTTTSANISGRPTPYSVDEVAEQLGEAIEDVALILDQGTLAAHEVSTIVDLTVNPPQLIRQGLISWQEISRVLKEMASSS